MVIILIDKTITVKQTEDFINKTIASGVKKEEVY